MSTNADLHVRLAEVNLYITCMYYNLLYMYNAAYPHTRYITLTTSVRCHNRDQNSRSRVLLERILICNFFVKERLIHNVLVFSILMKTTTNVVLYIE